MDSVGARIYSAMATGFGARAWLACLCFTCALSGGAADGSFPPAQPDLNIARRLSGGAVPFQKQLAELPNTLLSLPLAAGRGLATIVRRRGLRRSSPALALKEEPVVVEEITANIDVVDTGSQFWQGVSAVCGGFAVHMVLGTLYCWGNFIAYAPKYLQYFQPDSLTNGDRQPDALGVVPLIIVFQTIGLPLGAELSRIAGERVAATLGGLTVALGVYLSSFARDLASFMVVYGAVFGLGVGCGYTAPMSAGWTWFPKRRGLVNGLVLLGFGTGGFVFNLLGSKLVNPLRLSPPYPPEVHAAFPHMLRSLAACYATAAIVGGLLVRPKRLKATATHRTRDTVTIKSAITSQTFTALYIIIATTASAGLTSASIYKLFASTTFPDDNFLAATGALGALSNGFGRLLWATMIDFFGFKRPFAAMLVLQATNTALTPAAANSANKFLFLLSTCLAFFCLGGVFSMAPTCCAIAFGSASAPSIYSLLFSAFAVASLGGVQLAKKLVPIFGWTPVYHILAVASLAPFALLPKVQVQ